MIKAVVFGGTTEGRKLCEICAEHAIPVRYCVVTADGARQAEGLPGVSVHTGRLGADEMTALIRQDSPALVIDATHPYAEEASRNIAAACKNSGAPLLRVARESADSAKLRESHEIFKNPIFGAARQSANISPPCGAGGNVNARDYIFYKGIDELLAWLEQTPGNIFVTTGSSHAGMYTKLADFHSRVWLRILPSVESLRVCLDAGFRPGRLVCMQGPFSEELNYAMFKAADAKILVTKDSGAAGGFPEKVRAAQSLGMLTAVLGKPDDPGGISLDEARVKIMELLS